MSQIIYDAELNGRKIQVVGGWDRPLQGYHFTVYAFDGGENGDEEIVLYENTMDAGLNPLSWPQNNEHYKKVCKAMKLELPDFFWDAADAKLGSIQLRYNPKTDMWESR